MTELDASLRSLITDIVRDVLTSTQASTPSVAPTTAPAHAPVPDGAAPAWPGSEYVTRPQPRTRVEPVRITNDQELAAFVRRVLDVVENPKQRADLRNGWLRFSLIGAPTPSATLSGGSGAPSGGGLLRIDSGAVTERNVKAAAAAGQGLLLGRRAVLTPMARERARSLGLIVEKEK